MHTYGSVQWERLWEDLEQSGNVGLDYVINPPLYREIVDHLAERPKATVVDFGCGTNFMGIQLLFGHAEAIPALQPLHSLSQARFNTLLYVGIEDSVEFVERSNSYLKDIGDPKNIATVQAHIDSKLPKLFDDHTVDLCVSRNFLMHLSVEETEAHFEFVAKALKPNGHYVLATLNPDYELLKATGTPSLGEQYEYKHGEDGEYGIFYHYYKDSDLYAKLIEKYFTTEKKIVCFPITEKYRESHGRYYDPDRPMAFVYSLRVKNRG